MTIELSYELLHLKKMLLYSIHSTQNGIKHFFTSLFLTQVVT